MIIKRDITYANYICTCFAVAFAFENIATLSLAVNLASYFIGILHMELADAANSLTNFMGTGFLLSIVVAVFADTVIGRFNATVISGCIEFLVTLTSIGSLTVKA